MTAFEQVFAGGGPPVTKYGVAEQERLEAGFEPDEVKVAVEKNTSASRRSCGARCDPA